MSCHLGCRCGKCLVLPDPPMVSADEADRLRASYEASRRRHREIYPLVTAQQIADRSR